jgi:hypothetical protein
MTQVMRYSLIDNPRGTTRPSERPSHSHCAKPSISTTNGYVSTKEVQISDTESRHQHYDEKNDNLFYSRVVNSNISDRLLNVVQP